MESPHDYTSKRAAPARNTIEMTFAAGTRFGSYEITEPLGKGGMGEVYRARDSKLKRDVAIKVLPDGFARDAARIT